MLSLFDVNRDGVVDAGDVSAVQRCVDAKAIVDGLACDVVPDGAIDDADLRALSVVLGEHAPIPGERRSAVVQALRDNARGQWQPVVSDFLDWNRDGVLDAADVLVLADTLAGDFSRFDQDGDGLVDLRDVDVLARRQSQARFSGGAAPSTDLDGDGASTVKDLLLLAELTLYTTDARPAGSTRTSTGRSTRAWRPSRPTRGAGAPYAPCWGAERRPNRRREARLIEKHGV